MCVKHRLDPLFYVFYRFLAYQLVSDWALTSLGLICVLVNPTTAGLGDSERALGYEEPWNDNVNN